MYQTLTVLTVYGTIILAGTGGLPEVDVVVIPVANFL